MKKLLLGALLFVPWALGCEAGEAVEVTSCSQCRSDEVCVTASGRLYCSNLCVDPTVVCVYGCDAMASATSNKYLWVCAPKEYYQSLPTGKKSYHKMGGNCAKDLNYQCPSGELCLQDVSEYSVFFCSEQCTYNTECAQGCCAETDLGSRGCAPFYYCP